MGLSRETLEVSPNEMNQGRYRALYYAHCTDMENGQFLSGANFCLQVSKFPKMTIVNFKISNKKIFDYLTLVSKLHLRASKIKF